MRKNFVLFVIIALTIASCNSGNTSTTTVDSTKVDSTLTVSDTAATKTDTVVAK
jgi:hypothetical protein